MSAAPPGHRLNTAEFLLAAGRRELLVATWLNPEVHLAAKDVPLAQENVFVASRVRSCFQFSFISVARNHTHSRLGALAVC